MCRPLRTAGHRGSAGPALPGELRALAPAGDRGRQRGRAPPGHQLREPPGSRRPPPPTVDGSRRRGMGRAPRRGGTGVPRFTPWFPYSPKETSGAGCPEGSPPRSGADTPTHRGCSEFSRSPPAGAGWNGSIDPPAPSCVASTGGCPRRMWRNIHKSFFK